MDQNSESPFRVAKATKERVDLPPDELFGNRRWVIDEDGGLEERHGAPREGDRDILRTVREELR